MHMLPLCRCVLVLHSSITRQVTLSFSGKILWNFVETYLEALVLYSEHYYFLECTVKLI